MLTLNVAKISERHLSLELNISDVETQSTKNFKFTVNLNDLEDLIFKLNVIQEDILRQKNNYENQ